MSSDQPAPEPNDPPAEAPRLSGEEATQLSLAVANLTSLGLPLATGLKALAEETPGSALAAALNLLAEQLEKGVPFDQALEKLKQHFPPHVRGLISVGLRTGELGEALADYVVRERAMRARRRRLRRSLAYPLLLLLFSLPVLLFMVFFLVPQFSAVFEDFGLELPEITIVVFAAMDQGAKALLLIGAIVVFLFLFGRWIIGVRWMDKLTGSIPLLGPALVWSRVANFSQILGTLIKHQVPLPEALEYTAHAVSGKGLQKESRRLSAAVAGGASLDAAINQANVFPPLLAAFVSTGEKMDRLPAALEAMGIYAAEQVDLHGDRIRLILPIVIFTAVLFLEVLVYLAIMAPMMKLVSSLTG